MLYNLSTGWKFHAATPLPCKKELAVLIGPRWPDLAMRKISSPSHKLNSDSLVVRYLSQLIYQLEGMIILKWILHKQSIKLWTEFCLLRIPVAGFCKHGDEHFSSLNARNFFCS